MLSSFIARLLPVVAYLTNVVSGLQWAGSGKVIPLFKKITLGFLREGLTWLSSPEALLHFLPHCPHHPTFHLSCSPWVLCITRVIWIEGSGAGHLPMDSPGFPDGPSLPAPGSPRGSSR